jgi:hypothetical protein
MKYNHHVRHPYIFVWGEWFENLVAVAADPRCPVDYQTLVDRLELVNIRLAVQPELASLEGLSLYRRELVRRGIDLEICQNSKSPIYQQYCKLQNIPYTVRGDAPKFKVTVKIRTFDWRYRFGWDVYSAALQNFTLILNGTQYFSWDQVKAAYPWLCKAQLLKLAMLDI